MKKEIVLEVIRWACVLLCTMVCMVLIMAEPLTEGYTTAEWLLNFFAMKFGAVACGIIALSLAGKLQSVIDTCKNKEA